MAEYFGTNGVRGTLDLLTPEFVSGMAAAFGTFIGGGKVLVGTDARTSRELVKHAAIAGLLSAGCDTVDLGVVPSPTVELEVRRTGAAGGIIATASHNPPEWNALKFVGKCGIAVTKERGEEIESIFSSGAQRRAKWDGVGSCARWDGAVAAHSAEILKRVDAKAVAARRPFLVLDCGNGAAGGLAPGLFRALGCRVATLNAQPDGFFPGRNSEPTKANVSDLVSCVTALGADMGIAWDGDCDRVIFIDEKGGYVWGDQSFALCARIRLRETAGRGESRTVVTTVATGNAVKEAAEREGGSVEHVRVGAPYIAERMAETGALMGGEEVGGVVWPELGFGKDGFMTAAKIVEESCVSGAPLSEMVSSLPVFFNAKGKADAKGGDKAEIMLAIRGALAGEKGAKPNTVDGIRLDFPGAWVIVRPSGTEDYFRIFAEAGSQDEADALLAKYKKRAEEIISGRQPPAR
jgi:phosphomannomutase/phosphoglucomutase